MKRILSAQAIPGMIVAEDVYSYNNQMIVNKGTELTDKIIARLAFYAVPSIKIEDGEDGETELSGIERAKLLMRQIEGEDDVPEEAKDSYSNKIKKSPEFAKFKQDFDNTITDFKSSMNDIVEKGAPIDATAMLDQADSLIKDVRTGAEFFQMLHNMRHYDDLTFAHCMNVALISNMLATWLKMSEEDVATATLCGLFHDIGKLAIPDAILKKPDKLTDDEFKVIKTHTVEGYKILQTQDVSIHVKNAALMHHEKCDGTGYPLGVTSDKIDPFAKIVAIADVYDAMTAARVYRGAMCPFVVIEIFEKEGLQKYDPQYILTFLTNVVNTYMNHRVRLSDGTVGDIVFINQTQLSRPMIKTIDGQFINLIDKPDLSIEAIL